MGHTHIMLETEARTTIVDIAWPLNCQKTNECFSIDLMFGFFVAGRIVMQFIAFAIGVAQDAKRCIVKIMFISGF